MAASSPWQSPPSISLNSSPIFPLYHHRITKRHRMFASSSSSSSSSFCCNCSGGINGAEKRVRRKSLQSIELKGEKNEVVIINDELKSQKINSGLSLKSLFGKRALWRRILFASKKVRSIILLNLITIIYASNIPVVKEVEAIIDPGTFTVVRFALTAIPFLPFVIQARDDVQTRNAGIELGFWCSLGYLMQALGMLTSDAGRASFIAMFTVIVVPLLDGMLGTIIPTRTWFGAFISLLGVALLESSGSPPCVGDLLNFLSAVFFGVHMLRTEHISRSTSRENFLPLLGYQVCVVALVSIAWYLVGSLEDLNISSWTSAAFWDSIVTFPWIPALYTGIFSTGTCLWVEMAAMRDVSATETAIIYGLEPFWGAGFAWFLLGERWGVSGWIGAALVLGGSLTVQIYGATSTTPSVDVEKSLTKDADLLISDKQNGFAKSPIVIRSREDSSNLLKKRDRH